MKRLAIGALVIVGATADVAGAHERGMAFRDNRPLALSLAEAQAGHGMTVCNGESREATDLDARFDGFKFKPQAGKAPSADDVFEKLKPPAALAGGDCAGLTIRAQASPNLAPDSYTGVVTVSSRGAGLARVELTITVEPARKALAPTGLLADAPLRANRDGPAIDFILSRDTGSELEDGGYLPLEAPKRGLEKLEPRLPPKGTPLGSIFNGSDRARVFVAGPALERDDVWLLPLRVDSADVVGDYKGKLDVAGSGDLAKAVPVTLTVTDDWEWVVGAIAIGALLPIVLQLMLERWRPRIGFWRRRRGLKGKYRAAESAFNLRQPPFPGFDRPPDDKIEEYNGELKTNTKRYARSVIFLDPGSEAYKFIDKGLRQAEDDARCFGAEDGLHDSLKSLVDALTKLADYLTQKLRVHSHPRLIRTAGKLITGRQLKIGAASALKAETDDFVAFIGEWKAAAERTRLLELWLRRLAQLDPRANMPPGDLSLLERAAIHVAEAKQELMGAPDRSALEAVKTSDNLDAAYTILAYLGAKHQVQQPDADRALEDYQVDWERMSGVVNVRANLGLEGTRDQSYTLWKSAWEAAADFGDFLVDVTSATAGVVERGLWRLWDIAIIVGSVLIGIAAGLTALYFGKTFGTTGDYVTAIAVGSASAALSKGVLDAVTKMRAQDAEPLETESPKPATVVAKAT